jgi:hypothetical protein
MTPVLGAAVGAHRLEGIVTSDVLGTVYAARDERSGRQLLVRLLLPLADDPAARRRFQIEMAAIARLDHPSILPVEDWGEWEGVPYVVTADPGAQRLATILASGRRLQPRFVMGALRDLAAALDHAHLAGVVHADVEPASVLVAADGSVRLSDFGLTLLVGASPDRDVYGLTAIARDLLSLAPPPAAARPAVDAVLGRGMAEDPRQRWETCGAMVEALRIAASGRPPEPAAPAASLRLPRLGAVALPRLGAMPRRLPLWIGLGAAVLAVLIVAFLAARAMRPSPSLALSVGSARVGDTVTVSGANLPAGQPGTVVLVGRPAPLGEFNADEKGRFTVHFVVPLDVSGGQRVDVCWGGSCPLSQALVVQAQPTPVPTATAAPVPVQTLTPPAATPAAGRFATEISLDQAPRRDQTIQVQGRGFDPAQQYVIVLQQGDRRWVLQTPASPDGEGAFSSPVRIPGDARRGPGVVAACISQVGTGQTTSCAQQQVFIGGGGGQ